MRYALAFVILLMPACASDRYLSEAEDADMRAKCEKTNCVVIPGYLWEQIKAVLSRALGVEI